MLTDVFQYVLFFIVCSILLAGCQRKADGNWDMIRKDLRSTFPTVRQISTEELHKWMADKDRPVPILIDRREREEYDVSHLSGAFHADSMEDVIRIITQEGRDRPVVLYCSVGYRSSVLARQLGKEGYTNIYNLEGSIFKWANEGRPVYQGDMKVNIIHPYDSKWRKYLDRNLWYTPGKQ